MRAMIPYFPQPELDLGLLTIHAFGVLVAFAVMLGSALVRKRAALAGVAPKHVEGLLMWILVAGFIGAHLFDRFVYFPERTLRDPASIIRIWDGMSSFGGFIGALVGIYLYVRREGLAAKRWELMDAITYALPFGWILGRTGCFVAFDHPGAPTSIFLGMADAKGIVRHNLGLDEAIYTVFIAALFFVLGKKPRRAGFFTGLLAIVYAPIRFSFDFLRIVDVRYARLTPGQWGSLALVGLGIFILRTRAREI